MSRTRYRVHVRIDGIWLYPLCKKINNLYFSIEDDKFIDAEDIYNVEEL